jgi:hypothetical protein
MPKAPFPGLCPGLLDGKAHRAIVSHLVSWRKDHVLPDAVRNVFAMFEVAHEECQSGWLAGVPLLSSFLPTTACHKADAHWVFCGMNASWSNVDRNEDTPNVKEEDRSEQGWEGQAIIGTWPQERLGGFFCFFFFIMLCFEAPSATQVTKHRACCCSQGCICA